MNGNSVLLHKNRMSPTMARFAEIVEDLEAALVEFSELAEAFNGLDGSR